MTPPTHWNDVEVISSQFMVGAKVALQSGAKIFVSPAMFALLTKAESEAELRFLVDNIQVQKIPPLPCPRNWIYLPWDVLR